MKHVTVRDLDALAYWLNAEHQLCVDKSREVFARGDEDEAGAYLAGAYLAKAFVYAEVSRRIQNLIFKELKTHEQATT